MDMNMKRYGIGHRHNIYIYLYIYVYKYVNMYYIILYYIVWATGLWRERFAGVVEKHVMKMIG